MQLAQATNQKLFFHAAGMVFRSFSMHLTAGPDLCFDEENLSLLNLAECTTLPGTAAALAPLTRAHIQHSREKCKSSYSAFAVQLGLKSLANSPNSAGYSSDRSTDASECSLPGRQNGTYSTVGPTMHFPKSCLVLH